MPTEDLPSDAGPRPRAGNSGLLQALFAQPNGFWSRALRAGCDAVLINAAFVLAYVARYVLEIGGNVEAVNYVSLDAFLPVQLALTFILIFVYRMQGLYHLPRGESWLDELATVFGGTLVGIAAIIFVLFLLRPFYYSRLIFVFAGILIVVLLGAFRLLWGIIQSRLRQRGIGVARTIIVGAGTVGRAIMQNLAALPELGYQVVGFVDDDPQKQEDLGRFKALGPTDGIVQVVREQAIDEVIITLPWISHRKIMAIMDACQRQRVRFRIVPDLFELSLSRVDIDEVNGIPLIGLREVSISRTSWLIKRAVDVVVATIGLVLASPLMLLAAIAVKLNSPGPAMFAQVRVGQGGRLFTVYKFRSMRLGAEEELPELAPQSEVGKVLFKMRHDPRHTSVGRFLRRSSIDELPQFYNVLRGEMSVVGPRPAIPSEVAQYEDWHRKRLEVPPGITGLWQVMGRSEVPFDEMVMLDIYYIENWSLGLDFRIMLRTIPTVLSGRGAY